MLGAGIGLWGTIALWNQPASALSSEDPWDFWENVEGPRKAWKAIGWMDARKVRESSGLVKSRTYDDVYWTHGDSFNEPAIFAVRADGEVLAKVRVTAPNVDWEDIAIDDDGFLYIADIGNNWKWLGRRHIFKVREPNPFKDDGKTARVETVYSISYPKKAFDAEAFFVHKGIMYLVSRHDETKARIYRLALDEQNAVTLKEIAALRVYLAAGADLSPDGTRLAVCTIRDTWIYDVNDDMTPVEGKKPAFVRYPNDQVEACCWDGGDLVLTNERGRIFRVTAEDIETGVIFVPPVMMKDRK